VSAAPKWTRRYQQAVDAQRMAFGVFLRARRLRREPHLRVGRVRLRHHRSPARRLHLARDREHVLSHPVEGASVFLRTASTEPAEVNLALDMPIDGVVLPNISSLAARAPRSRRTNVPPRVESPRVVRSFPTDRTPSGGTWSPRNAVRAAARELMFAGRRRRSACRGRD